jgi:hypothetical protein
MKRAGSQYRIFFEGRTNHGSRREAPPLFRGLSECACGKSWLKRL